MDLVKKFSLNTKDFQVYFDNDKKTYVALNLETGEKTNVGVLGTFLQMGILKPLEEPERNDQLLERLHNLEGKVSKLVESVNGINVSGRKEVEEISREEIEESTEEEQEEQKPKSGVAEEIMEKTLKRMSKSKEKAKEESDEELKNWMEI